MRLISFWRRCCWKRCWERQCWQMQPHIRTRMSAHTNQNPASKPQLVHRQQQWPHAHQKDQVLNTWVVLCLLPWHRDRTIVAMRTHTTVHNSSCSTGFPRSSDPSHTRSSGCSRPGTPACSVDTQIHQPFTHWHGSGFLSSHFMCKNTSYFWLFKVIKKVSVMCYGWRPSIFISWAPLSVDMIFQYGHPPFMPTSFMVNLSLQGSDFSYSRSFYSVISQ